jgi:hypothetical protein
MRSYGARQDQSFTMTFLSYTIPCFNLPDRLKKLPMAKSKKNKAKAQPDCA